MADYNTTKIILTQLTDDLRLSWQFTSPPQLALDDEFAFELTRILNELSQVENLKPEAAIGFSLAMSDVNNFYLSEYIRLNEGNNTLRPIPVQVVTGHHTWHFDELIVLGTNLEEKTYECELSIGSEHWITLAEKTKVVDYISETFELTKTNLEARWPTKQWEEGLPMAQFPVANYAAFFGTGVSVEDMRPWLFITGLIEEGLCNIGWNLESPLLQSNYGRSLLVYFLREKFYQHDGANTLESVFVGAGDSVTMDSDPGAFADNDHNFSTPFQKMGFQLESYPYHDDNNNYQANTGSPITSWSYINPQANTAIVKIKIIINAEITVAHMAGSDRQWNVFASDKLFTQQIGNVQDLLLADAPQTVSMTLEGELELSAFAGPNNSFFVYMNGGRVLDDSSLSVVIVPETAYLIPGDILDLKTMINPDLTLLDLLKGWAHLNKARFETNWETKTLGIYTPISSKTPGVDATVYDGFLQTNLPSIEIFPDQTNRKTVTPNAKPQRYLRVGFKTSSDAWIKDNRRLSEEGNQPWQFFVDRGVALTEETEISRNPLFEPTLSRADAGAADGATTPCIVPYLWDNTDGDPSVELAPRILYYHGYDEQLTEGAGSTKRQWKWEGVLQNFIPGAVPYQYFECTSLLAGANAVYNRQNESGASELERGLDDFWYLYWKSTIFQQIFSQKSILQVFLRLDDYRILDFRRLVHFYYLGELFTQELTSIESFNPDSQSLTTVSTIGSVNVFAAYCEEQQFVEMEISSIGDHQLIYEEVVNQARTLQLRMYDHFYNGLQIWPFPTVATQNITPASITLIETNIPNAIPFVWDTIGFLQDQLRNVDSNLDVEMGQFALYYGAGDDRNRAATMRVRFPKNDTWVIHTSKSATAGIQIPGMVNSNEGVIKHADSAADPTILTDLTSGPASESGSAQEVGLMQGIINKRIIVKKDNE